MINVCPKCGTYRADKDVDVANALVICPACAHEHPFHFGPLYLVGGASGAGKSAVIGPLLRRRPPSVVLEADVLWRPEFDKPDDQYRDFHETWLRLAKNIAQSGRPVLLLGAGFAVPENIEACVEARYFSPIRYLALVCDDDLLAERLRARPAWRGSSTDAFIQRQVAFNRWCREHAAQRANYELIDTSTIEVEETAARLFTWAAQ